MALVAGIFTSCNSGEEEPQVKITPIFSAKVQQYDMLGDYSEGYAKAYKEIPISTGGVKHVYTFIDIEGNEIPQCQYEYAFDFSEGLAAVMKDGKYGFINTNGEVVIPFNYEDADCFSEGLANVQKDGKYCYINKEGVEVISIPKNEDEYIETTLTPFSEDVAFVIKPQDWESFVFYAIDKTGKKLFEGKLGSWCGGEGDRFQSEYMPKFSNGEVYIPATDYDTYDVYNKQGLKLRTEKGKPKTSNKEYIIYKYTEKITEEDELIEYAIKKIEKEKNVEADTIALTHYDEISELKNGVALACLYEYDENAFIYGIGEGGYDATLHYGYVDLDGNDTFSQEIKERCWQSIKKAKSKYADYKSERKNPTWLNGTWRFRTDYGYIYQIFNKGKLITYAENSQIELETNYTIDDTYGRVEMENGGYLMLDYDRDIVVGADGGEWSKYSNSTTIDPQLQGSTDSYSYSNRSYSNEQYSTSSRNYSTEFFSATSVLSYLQGKTFRNGGTTLRVEFGGMYFNGQCLTAAPIVETYSSNYAVVSAQDVLGGKVRIRVYPTQNRIVDNSTGESYYCN